MIYRYVRFNILMIILFFSLNVHSNQGKKSYVYLDYNTDRSIQGVLHLDRKNILMCDSGVGFDQRIDQKSFDTLVLDYNINFGRNLGLVKWWSQQVEEDINRPGYANIDPLKNYQTKTYSDTFVNKCGPSLDVSCHGVPNFIQNSWENIQKIWRTIMENKSGCRRDRRSFRVCCCCT